MHDSSRLMDLANRLGKTDAIKASISTSRSKIGRSAAGRHNAIACNDVVLLEVFDQFGIAVVAVHALVAAPLLAAVVVTASAATPDDPVDMSPKVAETSTEVP